MQTKGEGIFCDNKRKLPSQHGDVCRLLFELWLTIISIYRIFFFEKKTADDENAGVELVRGVGNYARGGRGGRI